MATFTAPTIREAFRATGIEPFNSEVFTDLDFAASFVTDVNENQNVNEDLAIESSQKFAIDAFQDTEMDYDCDLGMGAATEPSPGLGRPQAPTTGVEGDSGRVLVATHSVCSNLTLAQDRKVAMGGTTKPSPGLGRPQAPPTGVEGDSGRELVATHSVCSNLTLTQDQKVAMGATTVPASVLVPSGEDRARSSGEFPVFMEILMDPGEFWCNKKPFNAVFLPFF
jgi:hypothetical protein